MARILVLGPSAWRAAPTDADRPDPISARRRLRDRLAANGHTAFLLEDLPGQVKPLRRKFLAAIRTVTDVIVYWPKGAKMVTTQQELAILPGVRDLPRIWILAHQEVANMDRGFFELTEHGDRGRYTDDILDVATAFIPWETGDDLDRIADLVAESLHSQADTP